MIFYSSLKQFQVFQKAKFEFKVYTLTFEEEKQNKTLSYDLNKGNHNWFIWWFPYLRNIEIIVFSKELHTFVYQYTN